MERTLSKLITYPVNGHVNDALPSTIAGRTRRVYDALSLVYPMSTFFFHSKAHTVARWKCRASGTECACSKWLLGPARCFTGWFPRIRAAAR